MRSAHGLAALAAVQHGVVATRQLRELGYTSSAISRLRRAGRLHRVHRGVYAVGHTALSRHGRCMAAVLACGERTVLSHRAAAWLWGIAPTCPRIPDVTVPRHGHARTGIHLHHASTLLPDEGAKEDGLPVTVVSRTLLDLAAVVDARGLQRLVDRAKRLDKLELPAIDAMLERRGAVAGSVALRRALELYRRDVFDRARSELAFLELVERAGLPRPALNLWVAGYEVDAYWEDERFAVEIDGWEWHRTRTAFEADRLRQEELKLAGVEMIRVTARRIEREPDRVAMRLRALLKQRRDELARRRERS